MKEMAEKLREVEKTISSAKGPFWLFALFLREDSPDLWDLVVAAPWIEKEKVQALPYLADQLRDALSDEELLKLSRIVLIDEKNPALQAIGKAFHVKHGLNEVQNSVFFGLPIRHAFIVTSDLRASH